MARKYLRKNEFRTYSRPEFSSKSGKAHPAHITAKHHDKYKFNVIIHLKTFFNSETKELSKNPNRNPDGLKDKRKSRVSVPRWDKTKYFSTEKLENWRLSKKDKATVKKWNKQWEKKKR